MTIHVLHLSQNIVNLNGFYLNDLKFFIMVAYTIFQAHVTYVTLKIAIKLMFLKSHVYTYLHAVTGLCTSFNKVYLFKYSFNKCLSFNCYVCYQMIHKLF